jgi:transposase
MRPTGTAQELERRRLRAVELVKRGESPDDVAHFLGCGRSSVYTWLKADRRRPGALAAKPHPGRTPRLDAEQRRRLEGLLLQGARAHGWGTELWTADRVAALIERHFGVRFHPEHARKILKRRLGWTSQKPQRRAKERDESAIAHWRRQELPRVVRRARRRGAHLVLLDESGFLLTPTVRRTLAPRGRTPVLRSWDRHDRISAISAITVSPRRRRLGLYFRLLPDDANVHGEDTVAFLRQLRRHLPGPMTVLWDRGNIHDRSRVVRAYLAEHPEIETEPFPSYAPELNPDEGVWGHTKYGRLANFAPEGTAELRSALIRELVRLQRRPDLLASFIRHAGFPIRLPRASH